MSRDRRRAKALLINSDALLVRAAQHLIAGDPLAAQRSARSAEHIVTLHARLRRQRETEARRDLETAQTAVVRDRAALDARATDLDAREGALAAEAGRLTALKADLDALYATIYAAPAPES